MCFSTHAHRVGKLLPCASRVEESGTRSCRGAGRWRCWPSSAWSHGRMRLLVGCTISSLAVSPPQPSPGKAFLRWLFLAATTGEVVKAALVHIGLFSVNLPHKPISGFFLWVYLLRAFLHLCKFKQKCESDITLDLVLLACGVSLLVLFCFVWASFSF